MSVGVVLLTLNAANFLPRSLPPLMRSSIKPKVLVVDSSSDDNTVEIARELGAEVLVIPREQFNHGLTREQGRHALNTDIVVMMTQDAIASDEKLIERLVKPILEKRASASYAKQLPHPGADFFAAFSRSFNYPQSSHVRSLAQVDNYGVYTFFCSNSCAAYSQKALNEIGGFKSVLFGEDTLAVAELLHKGDSIAYVAEAAIYHSHNYSLWQEFRRHFDIGLSRKNLKNLLAVAGKDEKRGRAYFSTLVKKILKERPGLLPYAFLQTGCKFLGYRLGRSSEKAPLWFKKLFSSQSFYWKNSGKQ